MYNYNYLERLTGTPSVNIFYLDPEPAVAAAYHNDKHVVKMVLETAQMLSTAHHMLDASTDPRLYKKTHYNHPCSIWVRTSRANYMWAYLLMIELDLERQRRFTPRLGKTIERLGEVLASPPQNLPDIGFTPPAQAMAEECKRPDPVEAYREYYRVHKRHIASWKKREAPSWWF